jgi:hypothetical protein
VTEVEEMHWLSEELGLPQGHIVINPTASVTEMQVRAAQENNQPKVILGVTSDTTTKAVTPTGAVEQRDINYTAGTLDKDNSFRADRSENRPKVTLREKQTGGNDKPITCNPCTERGTFDDSIHVSGKGKTFTIEQKFEVNGKPATIYKMDASGKLISGTSVRVQATDAEVKVNLVP